MYATDRFTIIVLKSNLLSNASPNEINRLLIHKRWTKVSVYMKIVRENWKCMLQAVCTNDSDLF